MYRLTFKDRDRKPITLTHPEAEAVKEDWRKKQIIEIMTHDGSLTFNYTEIKAIDQNSIANRYEGNRFFTTEDFQSRAEIAGKSEVIWKRRTYRHSPEEDHVFLKEKYCYYKEGKKEFVNL